MDNKTNWDCYYKKCHKTAPYSRSVTTKKIISLLKKHSNQNASISELGGANSCFYQDLNRELNPKQYTIFDNNTFGLKLFVEKYSNDSVTLHCEDLLKVDLSTYPLHDVVFSVGLIEHFPEDKTAQMISNHFNNLKTGGICLIAFPTPTWLYKLTRKIAELLKLWPFVDERPLHFIEVEEQVKKFGTILHKSITWPIFLTQGVVVAKKD